jgi:hypothetical protein
MWRKKVNKSLRPYLEKFIAETHFHKKSFNLAKDPGKAQIWIAIALLSKQIYNLEVKLNYLEKALKDLSQVKESEKFIQEIENQVKSKGKEKKEEREEGKDRLEIEKKALETGASLLSRIARGTVRKKRDKKVKIKQLKMPRKKREKRKK